MMRQRLENSRVSVRYTGLTTPAPFCGQDHYKEWIMESASILLHAVDVALLMRVRTQVLRAPLHIVEDERRP